MEKDKMYPFKETEKVFAEKNHNLVYAFLHTYKYSIEEHYQVVIFGYLKAVQVYHRNKELREKYDFQYIAWQYMRSEIGNHFKVENAKKRKPVHGTVSLDVDHVEKENLYNCIGGRAAEVDVLEKELLEFILENLSERQRKIVCMKVNGYSNREMILFLEIPSSTYYREMERIKAAVENILDD